MDLDMPGSSDTYKRSSFFWTCNLCTVIDTCHDQTLQFLHWYMVLDAAVLNCNREE